MAHKWLIKREGLTSLSFLCPFPILQPLTAGFHLPGQIGTAQDKSGHSFPPIQI